MLHDLPGVKVERNVQLPPIRGDQTRRREIDVLLTGYVTGYPVRIAFYNTLHAALSLSGFKRSYSRRLACQASQMSTAS